MKRTIKKKVRDLFVYYNWFFSGKSGIHKNMITSTNNKNKESALRALRNLKTEFNKKFPRVIAYYIDRSYSCQETVYCPSIAFIIWLQEHYRGEED